MLIENVQIGSDVEYFLRDKKSGEVVSAEDIIKGTKYEPFKFDKDNNFFATSLDNVLAEGNIPPAKTSLEFITYLSKLRGFIEQTASEKGLETLAQASARLDQKWLQTENAKIFGCDPSLNCWTGEVIHPQPTGDNLRSAGFHVHVGYDGPEEEKNILLAQAMDLYLGVPSILKEPENERKQVGYGQAGNFRHQIHGVEYRVLSSFFASDKSLIEWAFNNSQIAVNAVNDGTIKSIVEHKDAIIEAINNNNKDLAQELVGTFNIPV